jgi:hypothetical protein
VGPWHIGNFMKTLSPVRLHELKTQAAFLLKDLKSNSDRKLKSANRFLQLPFYSDKTTDWIISNADQIQLKHAYQLIAFENGFKTWADLKRTVIEKDCLYRSNGVAFIHSWFKDYQKAEAYHLKNGGYLLSIWKDFIVCGNEYIECLRLHHLPEDWKKIGYNWAKPKDKDAWFRLFEKASLNYLDQN